MISYTETAIFYKDLDSGLVKKKKYDDKTEYWVYRQKKGNLYLPDGSKTLLQDKENSFLFCVVVAEKIVKKTKKGILVKGLKLTGEAINKYLTKTNRHVD